MAVGAHEDEERWPLKNVWAGTSVEDQATADKRIPHLLETPAAACTLAQCRAIAGPIHIC